MPTTKRLYGYNTNDDARRQATNPSVQAIGEVLPVHATANARRFRGPGANGMWSAHVVVTAVAGATSALTVWYSNLPDPDPTVDAQWSEVTAITDVDLTALGGTMLSA